MNMIFINKWDAINFVDILKHFHPTFNRQAVSWIDAQYYSRRNKKYCTINKWCCERFKTCFYSMLIDIKWISLDFLIGFYGSYWALAHIGHITKYVLTSSWQQSEHLFCSYSNVRYYSVILKWVASWCVT